MIQIGRNPKGRLTEFYFESKGAPSARGQVHNEVTIKTKKLPGRPSSYQGTMVGLGRNRFNFHQWLEQRSTKTADARGVPLRQKT